MPQHKRSWHLHDYDDEIEKRILEYCRNADVLEIASKTSLNPDEVLEILETIQKIKK